MISLKIHEHKNKTMIAICDKDLLGKVYKDKTGICIDLVKYRKFYEGQDIDLSKFGKEELNKFKDVFKTYSSINAIGKESMEFLNMVGIKVENCLFISEEKFPHIQIYRI